MPEPTLLDALRAELVQAKTKRQEIAARAGDDPEWHAKVLKQWDYYIAQLTAKIEREEAKGDTNGSAKS